MNIKEFAKSTIMGGFLVLVPIGFLIVVLDKLLGIIVKVSAPVTRRLAVDGPMLEILSYVLAIIVLLLVCAVAGLLANLSWTQRRVEQVHGLLLKYVPFYNIVDGVVSNVSSAEEQKDQMIPSLVHFDDNSQLGLEIERSESGVVAVYIPGSPSPWSGATIYVPSERVENLQMKSRDVMRTAGMLGRGSTQYFTSERLNEIMKRKGN